MKKFTFIMAETDTYVAVFEAENYQAALKQLRRVDDRELDTTELPGFEKWGKEYEFDIAVDTLRESN